MANIFLQCFFFFIKQKKLALERDFEYSQFTMFNMLIIVWVFFLFLLSISQSAIGVEEPFGYLFEWNHYPAYRVYRVFAITIVIPLKDFLICMTLSYLFWFQTRKLR